MNDWINELFDKHLASAKDEGQPKEEKKDDTFRDVPECLEHFENLKKKCGDEISVLDYLKKKQHPIPATEEEAHETAMDFKVREMIEARVIKERKTTPPVNFDLKFQISQQIALKQRGNATEIIVDYIRSHNHIYTTKDDLKAEMWIYRDGIYIPHGRSEVKEIVRELLEEVFTTHIYNEVIAKIEADTYIDREEFFKSNYSDEIPLQNGILNIKTRQLSEFTPDKIFFNKLPVKYDPEASCPNIVQHFQAVLKSPDDIMVMFELLGYCLYKDNKLEKAFMFVGNGRNGKSKTLELIKRFVGLENCSSIPLKAMTEESFEVWDLFGKMVNLAGDLSKDDLKSTGMFKMLSGRDTISAKRKFLNVVKFNNYAKMIFACNDLPRVYDTSTGFWSRWIVLDFPFEFMPLSQYEKLKDDERAMKKIMDTEIMDRLTTEQEMSGLLNAALDGLDRLLKNKEFTYSKGTAEIKEMWIRKSDSFMAFCMDCLEQDHSSFIPKGLLRRNFNNYCKKHKIAGVSDKSIKATLEEMFGVSESRRIVNETLEHCWDGIRFNFRGIHEIHGFYTLYKILNLAIESNIVDTLDMYQIKTEKVP